MLIKAEKKFYKYFLDTGDFHFADDERRSWPSQCLLRMTS